MISCRQAHWLLLNLFVRLTFINWPSLLFHCCCMTVLFRVSDFKLKFSNFISLVGSLCCCQSTVFDMFISIVQHIVTCDFHVFHLALNKLNLTMLLVSGRNLLSDSPSEYLTSSGKTGHSTKIVKKHKLDCALSNYIIIIIIIFVITKTTMLTCG